MMAILLAGASLVMAPRLQAEESAPNAPETSATVVDLTFTYQGQLKQNNSPINGNADFKFTVTDETGDPFGTTNVTLPVSNGIFTAVINSPGRIWDGQARLLEIAVRFPSGVGSFTTLTPRQPIRAVPYAMGLAPFGYLNGDGQASNQTLLTMDALGDEQGLWVSASQGKAISGNSGGSDAVSGASSAGNGVRGSSGSSIASGIYGENTNGGYGVAGRVTNGGTAIFGDGHSNGLAGRFIDGDVELAYGGLYIYGGDIGMDSGNLSMYSGGFSTLYGKASFGATTRQMIDLWGSVYGIGVQSYTVYNRTDLGAGFAWYQGGVHSDVAGDPGAGGTRLMYLDANGRVMARNGLWAQGLANNPNPLSVTGLSDSDVEFRVNNAGEVFADGTFHPGGADFAELLPATAGLEPGDALIIGRDGKLAKSTEAYQSSVVGVYSTQPGVLGGSNDTDHDGKVPLAVVGVVPVKVTDENGPIAPGDLLTTSSVAGRAMRASPETTASGRTTYPSGSIIGKALSGFEQGEGTVDALLIAK
jgi:hypothetical protein